MAAKSSYEEIKRRAQSKRTGKPSYEDIKEKAAQKRYSEDVSKVDDTYIKSFFDDAHSYISDSQKELDGMSWEKANSYSTRDNRYAKTQDLGYRANLINYYLENNKDKLDSKAYSELTKALEAYKTGFAEADDAFGKYRDYYSQWGSEDEYQTAVRYDGYSKKYKGQNYDAIQKALSTMEDGEEKDWLSYYQYEMLRDDADFSSKATSGWEKYQADQAAKEQAKKDETIWESIGRWLGTSPDTSLPMGTASQVVNDVRNDTSDQRPNSDWTKEQQDIYGYLYAENPSNAYKYAADLNSQINAWKEYEQMQAISDSASDNGWSMIGHTIGAIATAPLGLADYLSDLVEANAKGTISPDGIISPFEYSQAAQSGIASKLNQMSGTIKDDAFIIGGKGLGDIYSLGVSAANSMLSAFAFGGTGTLVNFIGQGGASAVDDALSRGATAEQALLYGTIRGALEGLTEMIPADELLKIGSSATLKNYLKQGLKQGFGELIEEGTSSFFGNIADNIIMQDKSNFYAMVGKYMASGMSEGDAKNAAWKKMAGDIAFDAMGGFATGSTNAMITGGVHYVVDSYKGNKKNIAAVKKYGDVTGDLIQEGLLSDPKSESYQLAKKYQQQAAKGKTMTGFQIRNLVNANEAQFAVEDYNSAVDTAKEKLSALGETKDVGKVAELVAKKVTGQELTRTEIRTLVNSFGSKVAKEMETEYKQAESTAKAYEARYKSLTDRVGEEGRFAVSESGETTVRGKEGAVAIAEITKIEDDQVIVRLENGEEVDAGYIDFATGDESLLYSAVADIERISPTAATAMVQNYDASSGVSVMEYVNGVDEAYTFGRSGYSVAELKAGTFAGALTSEQMMSAYELGKATRDGGKVAKADAIKNMRTAVEAETQKVAAEGKEAPKAKKMTITYNAGGGKVIDFDKANLKLTTKQKSAPALAKVFHEMGLGTNFELFASYVNKKGERVFLDENGVEQKAYSGVYRKADGTIRIDLNAYNGRGLTLDVMAHELTHFIQNWSDEKYQALADFLVKTYEKTDMSMHQRVLREQARLERIRGKDVSYDEAYDEVVANAMSKMLADGKVMERLNELKAQDMTLAQKLWEGLKKLLDKFFRASENESALFFDAADLKALKAEFEQMQQMWAEAFVEASDNFQANLMATEVGVEPVAVEDTSQFSYASLAEAAGFAAVENEDGTRAFTRDGKKVSEVTVEDIENSPIGAFINFSLEMKDISKADADRQKKMFAEICTMACKTNDFAMTMQFVGSAVFTGMKANADKQYGTTYDFPSICTKTQAVIDAMSAKMMAMGRGLKSSEIVQLYADVFASGNPVPCPECYVFSRWIGIGGLLDNIKKYQDYYGDMGVKDVADAYLKMKAEVSKFADEQGISFGKAKGALTSKLTKEFNKLTEKIEKAENQGEKVKPADRQRLAELEPMMNTVKSMTWLENVYFADSSLKKVNPNFRVPNEVLFDLNNGEAFASQYKEAWAFRTTQGAGYGKAITPYAEARLGEGVLVTNNTTNAIKGRAQGTLNNYFLNQNGKLDKQSREALKKARMKQKIQAFIGGQRFQSTSDARYENASDYLLAALEMQAMHGMVQAYTKVDGAVPAFSAWGFSINQSLMPLNGGLDANGNVHDTAVGGMKPSVAFENRQKHESAGTITIGVNDNHIRAMFKQVVRDFIIPYHASGGKADVVAEFRRIQEGKEAKGKAVRSTDYSRTQSDTVLSDEVLRWQGKTDAQIQRIHEIRNARVAILTGGNVNMTVVRSNRFLSALYDKLHGGEWDGVKLAKSKVESQIFPNEFWDQTVTYEDSVKITKDYLEYCEDLGFLHRFSGMIPSNGKLVPANGYNENGERVQLTDLAYKYDEKGNKTAEVEEFFWKVLTDRRMYDNNGNYLPQKIVTLNDTTAETVTGFAKNNQGREYDKAKAEALAKKIAGEQYSSQETDIDTSDEVNYDNENIKLKGVKGNATREESREAFLRRAGKALPEVKERGALAFGYRRYNSQLSQTIRAAKEGLTKLRIPVVVFEQMEGNRDGVTTIYNNDAVAIPGEAVFIHKDAAVDELEIVGHEGYHYLKGTAIRNAYDDALASNVDFASRELVKYQKKYVNDKYFTEDVVIGSQEWATFIEEVFAYITGDIHAGDPKGEVHKFLRDYDAVKDALDDLLKKQAAGKSELYSSQETDRDYLNAVNRGDMETAQRMVDEAAKKAGYNEEVFHGMNGRYNTYKSGNGQYGAGVYFTYDKGIAGGYGSVVDHLYVKVGRIADYDDAYKALGKRDEQTLDEFAQVLGFPNFDEMIEDWDNDPTDVASNSELIELLRNKGFEGFVDDGNAGFVLWDFDGIEYRIKSADPVTYDDNGNVIPLSERFNEKNEDIRYSSQETDLDSDGKQLTTKQMEFFRDSKLRDAKGRLIPMYHGTNHPNFTVFDPQHSDDKTSLFFTSDPDVANTYTNAQDYGRDVDPYNLITMDASAEQFNAAQERVGGGLRVVKITPEWIAEMKRIAAEKSAALIVEANKYADLLEEVGGATTVTAAQAIRKHTGMGAEFISYSSARAIGSALYNTWQPLYFIKDKTLAKKLRAQYDVARDLVEPVKHYAQAAETTESAIGQYTYTETNASMPFAVATTERGFGGKTKVGTENETVARAIDRSKWVEQHNMGNRYKVYLNLANPYVINAGHDLSGVKEQVTMEYDYREEEWTIDMDDETLTFGRDEFENFVRNAFDAKTYSEIKTEIDRENNNYPDQADENYRWVDYFIKLKDVSVSYVKPGYWNSLRFNGREGVKTREVAAWAKENGYDGVIYKNMKDAGGYAASKGLGGSTVAVAFSSEQVKSVENKNPTADPDIRYSTQETDNISNRDLLAGAFEGIVQNSIEYTMIQEYKDHIAELNKLEDKLHSLNDEIRKIRFTAGARDAAKLQKLEDEAKEIAKEINRYDKRLLNMEASEPLRKVIERERKKASQKTREHVTDILRNKKARAEQTELRHKIRKAVRDLNKILNRGNKKQNVKEDMKGFVSKALELADYLFTDHISDDDLIRNGIDADLIEASGKAQLVKETEDILTKIYDQADSLTDEEFTRLDAKRKANEGKLRDLLTAQRNRRLNTPVYQLFNDLVIEYSSFANSNQEAVKAAYDPKVEEFLRSYVGAADSDRAKALQNMRVADMTTEELWKLLNAYEMVLHAVRTANKLFVKGSNASIEQMVTQIVTEFGSRQIPDKKMAIALQKLGNKIGWDYEKLYYALDRIGSDAFNELIMNLANSENIVMEDIMEAVAFRDEMVAKYGFNNWDVNKKIDREFLDNTGKKFTMTLGELMSLYAYSRREGAWDHIEYGGFVFGEAALTNPKPADSYKLSKKNCESITSLLTKEQRGYVEDMQKFLSETMGGKGNEVSMMLYGIKMFGEKNYFPIHIAGQFKSQAQESQAKAAEGFQSMSNAGFTHAQNPNAKAPFVLEGFNEVWSDHVNEMSRYHGTVPALEDIRRVMNRSSYSENTAESTSVKVIMENHFGKEAVQYFDNLYREANSGAINDKLQRKSKKLLSLFRKNSVAYSLSVLVQQPASLVRAYAMIDRRHFGFKGVGAITSGVAKAVTSKWNKAYANAYNEMLKYAPGVTMTKEIGGFDTATGGSIRSHLLDTGKSFKQKWKTGTALEKGKAVLDVVDDNAIANLPNVADKIAWIEIWNACKREAVARNKDLKPNSEEFMQAVGERFTEVIRATQVYDSIFAKSPMLKSKNLAVQMLVSFMNEPNTVANMAEKAVRDISTKGNRMQGLRMAHVLVHSIIFTGVMKSLVYAMRDDDEDETYIEKYIESLAGSLMDDFNPLNYIPIARDVWSVAQGYDVERADMAIASDAIGALNKVIKAATTDREDLTEDELIELDKKVTEASWNLVESLAAFAGIPVKNIRREINALIDHARIAKDNAGKTTAMSTWDSIYEAVVGSIPFMGDGKSKTDKLYAAIMEGDATYVDRIKNTYKNENAYHNAVRKALREHDARIKEAAMAQINGDPSERVRIAKQIIADGFDLDDVIMAINAEINALTDDGSDDGAKKEKGFYAVDDFVKEFANGDRASLAAIRDDIITTAQKNGKTKADAEKDFASNVHSEAKDAYFAGSLTAAAAKKLLVAYADRDEEEANERVRYWAFQKANPAYKDMSEANVNKYYEFAEPANISLKVYAKFVSSTAGLSTIYDEWGDVMLSKREQVLDVIDSLPLTWQQKDALYLAAGYSESTMWDVPW